MCQICGELRYSKYVLCPILQTSDVSGISFFRARQLRHCQPEHECKPSGPGRAGSTWYYFLPGRYLRFQAGLRTVTSLTESNSELKMNICW